MTVRRNRATNIAHGAAYLFMLAMGMFYVIYARDSFTGVIIPFWAVASGLFVAVGSIGGLIAVVTNRPWFEYLFLPASIGGLGAFVYAYTQRIVSGQAADPVVSLTVMCVRAALLTLLVARWLVVRQYMRRADRVARQRKD